MGSMVPCSMASALLPVPDGISSCMSMLCETLATNNFHFQSHILDPKIGVLARK